MIKFGKAAGVSGAIAAAFVSVVVGCSGRLEPETSTFDSDGGGFSESKPSSSAAPDAAAPKPTAAAPKPGAAAPKSDAGAAQDQKGPVCPASQVECDDTCIDPQSDPDFCGASDSCDADGGTAGVACGKGEACVAGQCTKPGPHLVGSFETWKGPERKGDASDARTCVAACALVFGGSASDYSCSTQSATIDHQAWATGWATDAHCQGGTPIAEDYTTGDYSKMGDVSAYLDDWCLGHDDTGAVSTNYCFSK